jgi:4-hydroxy-3-polyprenylbenzoate decarboxylase
MAVQLGLENDRNAFGAAALGDLRVFLECAEAAGELVRVPGVDANLEMGALFELSHEHLYPPVLLFENIKDYSPDFRILSNVRTARFVVGDLTLDAVKAYRKKPKEGSQPIPPRRVNTGPVFECTQEGADVNVLKFPAPLWHAGDGGRYIGTECVIICKDPDTDWVNLGTYRVMVHDEKTFGVFIEPGKHGDIIRKKYWARGEPCPMVITVGQAPILGTVAATVAPPGASEYDIAGGRIGRPIDVVAGRITGLPIPADAELAFEGFMPSLETESRHEGPFGEWPGYYASGLRTEAVMQVKAVYHRKDAIILGMPPTGPTMPGRQIKINRVASLWDALEAAGVPGIEGVWKMPGGGTLFIDIIAIKQLHAGHAKMAGLVSAGCAPGSYMNRLIIIVDDDIDITNPAEVMWAVATRWDPKTQTDIIDGCWTGYIDPRLSPGKRNSGDVTTSRMIIYAVRPFHWKDQFPAVNAVSREYAEAVRKKWGDQLPFLRQTGEAGLGR